MLLFKSFNPSKMSLKRIQKAQNEKSNGKFVMFHSVKSLQNGVPFSERLRCE